MMQCDVTSLDFIVSLTLIIICKRVKYSTFGIELQYGYVHVCKYNIFGSSKLGANQV